MTKLLASANWSQCQWTMSFEPCMVLAQLLPKKGHAYTINLLDNEVDIEDGEYDLLWLPPHSELNGLLDRPYEVIKAHLIRAQLTANESMIDQRSLCQERSFSAKILSIEALNFADLSARKQSGMKLPHDFDCSQVDYYQWNNWLYIRQYDEYMSLDWLFDISDEHIDLVLCLSWIAGQYETVIERYKLSMPQKIHLLQLVQTADVITPQATPLESDELIRGAHYW